MKCHAALVGFRAANGDGKNMKAEKSSLFAIQAGQARKFFNDMIDPAFPANVMVQGRIARS